jgi:peptidoglycan/LPS O-acetylase OafA/YrhL
MPLFFLLAGWSAFGSLAARGPARFARERVRRLIVPLIFGIVVICPPIRWIELRQGLFATPSGKLMPAEPGIGLLEFLPRYFTLSGVTWSHLWFLVYLFTFSMLYLPLLARVARPAASGSEKQWSPAFAWAPLVPLALVQLTLRSRWPGFQNLIDDWANFAYYSLYFGIGFALARFPGFERVVQQSGRAGGVVGLLGFGGLMISWQLRAQGSATAVLASHAFSALTGWGFVVFLLGLASRRFLFSNRALVYLAESAFSVYVLHQLALVLLAAWVVTLPLGIALKFALLVPLSAAATLALVHFVVRPLAPLRFCLGMKSAPRPPRARIDGSTTRRRQAPASRG